MASRRLFRVRIRLHVFGDFLAKLRTSGEPAAERRDESIIALPNLRACSSLRRFGQRRSGGQPEAHEDRKRFDRNAEIAFDPAYAPVELIEPLCDGCFLPLGCIRFDGLPDMPAGTASDPRIYASPKDSLNANVAAGRWLARNDRLGRALR